MTVILMLAMKLDGAIYSATKLMITDLIAYIEVE